MAFWRRPQAEATNGETLTKKTPLARSTRTIYRSSWLWSCHRTIVKTIRSNVFNCDMKHRWPKREIMIRICMGEKVLICFSKDAVVTHSARKLKNSILGSTLYWFPKKIQHWNTVIGTLRSDDGGCLRRRAEVGNICLRISGSRRVRFPAL